MRGEEADQRIDTHRSREQEALSDLAPEVLERLLLLGKLDALGDDVERKTCPERDDRGLQGDVLAGADERAIHLEDVDREAAEVAQGGVTRSEIVHREADPERLQI